MRDKYELRFFVGAPTGHRSGAWRLWANGKSDVYVAARSAAGGIKISLHASGQCIEAFTQGLTDSLGGEDRLPGGTRRRHAWASDRGKTNGFSLAMRLVFPTSELRVLGPDTVANPPHLALPAAPAGSQVSVLIGFGRGGGALEHSPDITLLGDPLLADGSRLLVLARSEPMSMDLTAAIEEHRGHHDTPRRLVSLRGSIDPEDTGARIIIRGQFGDDPFPSFTEAALLAEAT